MFSDAGGFVRVDCSVVPASEKLHIIGQSTAEKFCADRARRWQRWDA
jgi:hypothetical protein